MNGEDQSTDSTIIPPDDTPAPRAQLVKLPPAAPGDSQFNPLANTRSQIAQELSSNPDLRRKLMASINAEVGDQSDPAKLAYIESVFNRSIARGKSLDQTISDKHYYPRQTISQLGQQPSLDMQTSLNPLIDHALAGSNISNFATGNQSPPVTSGNARVSFDPNLGTLGDEPLIREMGLGKLGNSDQFVVENPDKKWASAASNLQSPGPAIQQALSSERGGFVAPDVNATETSNAPDQASLEYLGGYNAAVNA
jgi:hypothetical protein